jgi:hypothetical protein
MLRKDLAKADIRPKASAGVVDFYALRYAFIKRLARNGASPAVAQRLARHCTVNSALNCYTRLGLEDIRGALNPLPQKGDSAEAEARSVASLRTGTAPEVGAGACHNRCHHMSGS